MTVEREFHVVDRPPHRECRGHYDSGDGSEWADPLWVECGGCHRGWCERCDPGPAALCPFCHGRGYSTAPRQRTRISEPVLVFS